MATCLTPRPSARRPAPSCRKQAWNACGSRRSKTRSKVSCEGDLPSGSSQGTWKPILDTPGRSPRCHVPAVGPGDHGADGDEQQIQKTVVRAASPRPRVAQFPEVPVERRPCLVHLSSPFFLLPPAPYPLLLSFSTLFRYSAVWDAFALPCQEKDRLRHRRRSASRPRPVEALAFASRRAYLAPGGERGAGDAREDDERNPLVMVGGFLGAGKTTTLARLARHYTGRGQKRRPRHQRPGRRTSSIPTACARRASPSRKSPAPASAASSTTCVDKVGAARGRPSGPTSSSPSRSAAAPTWSPPSCSRSRTCTASASRSPPTPSCSSRATA